MATLETIEVGVGELKGSVTTLIGKVDKVNNSVVAIEERCVARGETIESLKKTLYGEDGASGLVAKQIVAKQVCKNMLKNKSRLHEWTLRIVPPVVVAVVLVIIFAVYKHVASS